MTQDRRSALAADYLLAEHRSRKRFGSLPEAFSPRNIEEACAAQEVLVRLRSAERGSVAGYKLALTTPTMQKMTGFPEPAYGILSTNTVYFSPHVVRHAEHVRLGLECEVALRLAADLPASGAPYTREEVAKAVGSMMPAFEIVDDRDADYSKFAGYVLDFIADNAWHAAVVLGTPSPDWRELDLAGAHGRMHINGELAAEGYGRDVLGHPLNALVWLANKLAARGKSLERGMLIMTGSLVPTKFVRPGDAIRYSLEGFGEIACTIE